MSSDTWDPLHGDSADHLFWTTNNAGEAVPGIQTPLSLSVWRTAGSLGFERAGKAIGVLTEDEAPPAPAVHAFYGRAVMSVDFLRLIGDRMPGADGRQVVSGLVGFVPDGMIFSPTRRYHLNVLRRFPATFLRVTRELDTLVRTQNSWWERAVFAVDDLDEADVRSFLAAAFTHHERATIAQCVTVFTGVQPVHDALQRVIEKLGSPSGSILTAPVGGAEMAVVTDIWRASRGAIAVKDVVRAHGFHGPLEGELSSRVWRDDDEPLRNLIERYAARPDRESPLGQEILRAQARREAERELIASAPTAMRPAVHGLLALARRRLHLRGVAKRSMLQGLDGIRAGARRLGELLAADGRLDDPEDVFYVNVKELHAPCTPEIRRLVEQRRACRAKYQKFEIPPIFRGVPIPVAAGPARPEPDRNTVLGIGVSVGTAEGVARVVTDPAFTDVVDGEVLIAPTTDPSWSSIMFVAAALVVDIGGALSHAAVVARELGIPCVVNTRNGTSVIRTGDRVRVDGRAGTVAILEKAS